MRRPLVVAAALAAVPAAAQQFVPPAGYAGRATQPPVAPDAAPGMPTLTALPAAAMAERFRIDPGYARAAHARVNVVGA